MRDRRDSEAQGWRMVSECRFQVLELSETMTRGQFSCSSLSLDAILVIHSTEFVQHRNIWGDPVLVVSRPAVVRSRD